MSPLALPPLLPSSTWQGEESMGAVPIITTTQRFKTHAMAEGLHVVELFGGIGLGVLRAALAANYSIKCYTYVDKDIISRRVAEATLSALMLQYPALLPASAIHSFDKSCHRTSRSVPLPYWSN